jgi:hypothetical protein
MESTSSPVAALVTLARHHLRTSWTASVALVVFAGLVAAVPMALLSASRYGERAMDRFVDWSDPPDLVVSVCHPDFDPEVDDPSGCTTREVVEDAVARFAAMDGVRDATVGGFLFGQGGASSDPDTFGPPISGYLTTGEDATAAGRPLVLRGRIAHRDAPDEVMLSEAGADRYGVNVGDEFHLGSPGGIASATVVGVVRVVDTLLPVDDPTAVSVHVRNGWLDANDGRVAVFRSVLVHVEDGRMEEVEAAVQEVYTDQFVVVDRFIPSDQRRITTQALGYEAAALLWAAVAGAFGAAALIAQAVARRSRVELAQAAPLRAIGVTERLLAGVVVLRWVPVAVGAAAVAVVVTALSATLGPFGVARRAPWSAGLRLDAVPVLAGTVLVVVVVLASARLTVRRPRPATPTSAATVGNGVTARVASSFLRQSLQRRSVGSMAAALVVSAVALVCVMGAVVVGSSLQRVVDDPARFGAPYDALLPAAVGPPEDLDELDGVVGASVFLGTNVEIAGEDSWVQATRPLDGVPPVEPVILEGRAPATPDEVALGAITLEETGSSIGDTIEIPGFLDDGVHRFRVVGTAPITDGYENNVGLGGLFTPEGLARLDPSVMSNEGDVAVRLDPEDRPAALEELLDAHPEAFVPFPVPTTLRNASRITDVPVLLAVGGAFVAGATFVHALLATTRQRRGDLAILRVLGLRRSQSFFVVLSMAAALAAVAAVAGAFGGVVAGTWGWQLVASSFGVGSSPAVPVSVLLGAPLALVVVAGVAATWPARRAADVPPARILRAD